jgi:thioredoxin 1
MLEVDSGSFAEQVLSSDRPVVVDFWGPRCGPCLALMPQLETLETARAATAKFVKIDASKNRRLCLELRVMSLPTFLFYKEGEAVARLSGADVKIRDIEEQLAKFVAHDVELTKAP